MHPDDTLQQSQTNWSRILIGLGVVAAIVTLIIAVFDSPRFFQVYLIGYLFWVEIAVGCLGLVMLNNLINGRWLYPILRFAEAGARTMPLMALLFLPIILGLGEIYPDWAGPEAEAMYGGKAFMLQPTFFVLRAFIYIAVWSFLSYVLTNWSYKRDQDGNAVSEDTMRNFSAVGMIFYVLTTSLAGFDWTMSLVPEFFSSAFGWAVLSRMFLAMVAFIILALALYWDREPFASVVNKQVTNDLGAVLLMAFLVWIYFYAIQVIIIYSGNVSFNALWFDLRIENGWRALTQLFAAVHAVILLLMLIPGIKGKRVNLVALAGVLLLLRAVELLWVVMPTYHSDLSIQAWDFAPVIAVGGFWLAATLTIFSRHRALPVHHPSLGAQDSAAGAAEAYTATETV
ncbi:MAG: hypothetical protein ACFE0Q_13315 [Anaerolineae bacterium]